jgi:antitoxin (DNA-binding transcriptional repressor) of toxin-antitoxin stability system
MHTVTMSEAIESLAQLVEEVQAGGEVVILQGDGSAVKLVAVARAGYGSLKGQVHMADDFDAPLDHFADYMP